MDKINELISIMISDHYDRNTLIKKLLIFLKSIWRPSTLSELTLY